MFNFGRNSKVTSSPPIFAKEDLGKIIALCSRKYNINAPDRWVSVLRAVLWELDLFVAVT
jgi:hypothetical protein